MEHMHETIKFKSIDLH